jgi:FkbM family methyltransferase
VDVGANVGRWAAMAAAAFPAARIFALEIVPATYERLRANTASNPRIHAVNTGLADRPGWLRIRFNPAASTHATYTAYPHPWDREEALDCAVVTGDEFLRAQGIDAVDFLKIDVEGAEPLVLQGFGAALSQRRIRFVQFEYGRFNILTGFLLKDFYDLFRAHGYLVGKIYPDYVELREYDLGDEDFVGGNYLACPVEDPLRARLAGPRR